MVSEVMAMSAKELANYVTDQLRDVDGIRSIPMMGGYIFYINNRIFGGVYEAGMMVKVTEASRRAMPDAVPKPPYEGAKPLLPVTILDDREAFSRMVTEMYDELPDQKPRRKKRGV